VSDPLIDFAAMFVQYDICLMGRLTYEVASEKGKTWDRSGQRWIVVSTTLKPEDHPNITIISSSVAETVAALKAQPDPQPQKDIWLFGGGVLFRFLLDAGLVDTVKVSLMPVMLGSGTPLLP
jgi:dihydrofolate reductase